MTVGIFAPDANPILRWCADLGVIVLVSFLFGAFWGAVNSMLHWRASKATVCPPLVPHRTPRAWKDKAPQGFDRQRLNAVVSISARRS